MGLISLLLPAIVVAAIVYVLSRRSSNRGPAGPAAHPPTLVAVKPSSPELPSRPPLGDELDEWVAAGLISENQSAAIVAHTRTTQPPTRPAVVAADTGAPAGPRRIPARAEALGYLGAVLAVVGLVLLVSRYWEDMALGARLALSGAAAVVGLVGGFLVPEGDDPAFSRLRWSLWLASTAAFGLFGGVAAADGVPTEAAETIVLAVAGAVTLESGLLWFGRERPVQQLVALAGLVATAGAATAELTSGWPIGVTIWVCGAVLAAVGVRHLTTTPPVTLTVGGVGVAVGAVVVASENQAPGLLLFVMSGIALTALALVPGWAVDRADQAVLGAIGVLTLVQAVPGTLGYFSREAGVAAGTVTWLAGAALIVVGNRRLVRLGSVVEILGGVAMIGGAALTGVQWHGFAPLFGIATALGFLALGMAPERLLLSMLGSIGLLVNVPWAIGWFFPGEGRVPLLIMVSGVLVLMLAVFLAHRGVHPGRGSPRPSPPVPLTP